MSAQNANLRHQDDTDEGAAVNEKKTPAQKHASSKTKKAPSAFRTIGEVAEELDVQQHVLRFWETKFSQVRPLKRGGGRRYYRPEDIRLLKTIHHLLYTEGYTIKGVQKLMREQGKNTVIRKKGPGRNKVSGPSSKKTEQEKYQEALQTMLSELKGLRDFLEGDNQD